MASSIRLLVLGVVRIFQPVHGYDIRRELLSWHADEWGNIAPGSIYNAIKTLTRESFLAVTGTAQIGARPERTSYRLTEAGEREHTRLLRECWRQVQLPIDPLMPALAFMPMLPRAEVIGYLRDRLAQVERMLAESRWMQENLIGKAAMQPALEGHQIPRKPDGGIDFDDDFKPEHVYETFALMNARIAGELEWSRGFLERLEAGRYQMAEEEGSRRAGSTRAKQPAAAKPAAAAKSKKSAASSRPARPAPTRPAVARPRKTPSKRR